MEIKIIIGLAVFVLTTITAIVSDLKYRIDCPPLYWFLGAIGGMFAIALCAIN